MPAANSLLGLVGLATRRQLEHAVERKDRWHGLIRNVFAPYYLKFQETSLGSMPELPLRYSQDWERYIRSELDQFLTHDLESVGGLLDAAGFGTDKWERLQETGFPALGRLMDRVAEGEVDEKGRVSDAEIDAAVSEDLRDLLTRHPGVVDDVLQRIDLDTGRLTVTEEDVESSESYRQLMGDLDDALAELRRFRRGGQRALERIRQLETQLSLGREIGRESDADSAGANGHEAVAGNGQHARGIDFDELDEEREVAGLRKELRARESTIAALRGRLAILEGEVEAARDPDAALQARLSAAETELEGRDAQVVRLQERIETLQDELEARTPIVADESDELRQLRAELKTRDHRIDTLTEELAQAHETAADEVPDEVPEAPAADDDDAEDGENLARLQSLEAELRAREHTIDALRDQLEEAEQRLSASADQDGDAVTDDLEGQVKELRNDLRAREHTIEGLREQIARLEAEAQRVASRAGGGDDSEAAPEPDPQATPDRGAARDPQLQTEVESLRRDLRARESTITALRGKLETFEKELGETRDKMLAEVKKLAALTSGDLQLKPSEELDEMDADGLLSYARDVAEDLDVRRQTLDEGLQGVESVKGSFEETRKVYEEQQSDMERQLEQLRAEAESYRQQEREQGDEGDEGSINEMRETIGKQRQQLELLATRVRQLVDTNKDLNESNKKMYENMETAVKKVIPLRRQIDELENLSEALQRYMRHKHDRTFTLKKLQESGIS